MKTAIKRIIALGCVVALVLSFTACGKSDKDETTTPETTVVETTQANNETTQANNDASPAPGEISNASSKEEIANYYNEVMSISKDAKSVKGSDTIKMSDMELGNLSQSLVNTLNGVIDSILAQLFVPSTENPLPSFGDKNIKLLADDIDTFNVEDKGSSYVITIKPKAEKNPAGRNSGPQSRFFDVLEGVEDVVGQISQISFTSGGIMDNLKLNYDGGTGVITIDKATKTVKAASYHMIVNLEITNVSVVKVIKLSRAAAKISYDVEYK